MLLSWQQMRRREDSNRVVRMFKLFWQVLKIGQYHCGSFKFTFMSCLWLCVSSHACLGNSLSLCAHEKAFQKKMVIECDPCSPKRETHFSLKFTIWLCMRLQISNFFHFVSVLQGCTSERADRLVWDTFDLESFWCPTDFSLYKWLPHNKRLTQTRFTEPRLAAVCRRADVSLWAFFMCLISVLMRWRERFYLYRYKHL